MEDQEKEFARVILEERKSLEYKAKDSELLKAIEKAVADTEKVKRDMDKRGEKNVAYWKGNQLDDTQIHAKRAKIVDNRVFMALETMLPIMTMNIAEPDTLGEVSNDVREKLIKILNHAYEAEQKMQPKMRQFVRNWACRYVGVLKYRWNSDQGGFITEVVNPQKLGFDTRARDKRDCEYIFEWMEDSIGALIKKFPDAKQDLIKKFGKDRNKTKVRYLEFWGGGGKWVVHKLEDIILNKQKNPNFDYNDEQKNFLEKPEFPYIFGNYFNFGDSLYDTVTIVEQAIRLQDAVNKRKNQITDMIDLNKRVWMGSSLSVNREDFQDFLDEVGEHGLFLEGEVGGVVPVSGNIDQTAFSDLVNSLGEIDNIMGTHETTRGERRGEETLGGRQLLLGADITRVSAIVEDVIEQVLEEWYNAYIHILKVFSQEKIGFQQGQQEIFLDPAQIPSKLSILVKKGASVPIDRRSRMEMARELAQVDMIDPETLFAELAYAKPEERAARLRQWWMDQGKLQGVAAGNQAQQMARLKTIINSPQFKQLPPEQQQEIIGAARDISGVIQQKGGQ